MSLSFTPVHLDFSIIATLDNVAMHQTIFSDCRFSHDWFMSCLSCKSLDIRIEAGYLVRHSKILQLASLSILVQVADALPSYFRINFLRYVGPMICFVYLYTAILLRLPMAKDVPGNVEWAVLGVEGYSGLDLDLKTATFLFMFLFKGVLRAWLKPYSASFIRLRAHWTV